VSHNEEIARLLGLVLDRGNSDDSAPAALDLLIADCSLPQMVSKALGDFAAIPSQANRTEVGKAVVLARLWWIGIERFVKTATDLAKNRGLPLRDIACALADIPIGLRDTCTPRVEQLLWVAGHVVEDDEEGWQTIEGDRHFEQALERFEAE
jgi:hypothetical protein